ncbi:sensor domain-containing diguanylate cyclase [Cellulomonas sp. ATA003]|uniref:sensor domain-containing diguanylate cyclase n=1 Tax=Cellulomonas sp. ATA003 TaxID=3073064 RepID=UPI002872B383|nr:sensor domain-containing diguanylate cyclase [Cellulomonas sp. ATA003]WNB85720.1 sensor domain-containing diguanylate cyclase [Cellulomonas sp. ATA003]
MSELAAPADDRGRVARGPQDRAVLRAVARLATLAAAPGKPDDVLRELCGVAAQVLEVDGIGVMKLEPGGPAGRVELVHAETPVHDLERLQGSLQAGACRDAIDSLGVVAIGDIRERADRYGDFATAMLAAGMHAVLAAPLTGRGRTWGSLDLYRRRPGAWCAQDVEAARLLADLAVSHLALASDRDEARAARREVEHRSLHDALTGLPTRALLYDRIDHALVAARRHSAVVGVAFVDLDRFKAVNDTLGHAAGDDVLVEVARRLASVVRAEDTLARLAGDEFVVVLADLPADAVERGRVLVDLVARLRRVLEAPVHAGGHPVAVTASIGVVVPEAGRTPSAAQLIHEADGVMYAAKVDRDAVVVHDGVRDGDHTRAVGVVPGRVPSAGAAVPDVGV